MLILGIAFGMPLLALCAVTAWLILRARGRTWVYRRSGAQLIAAVVIVALPWVALHFAHGGVHVSIHSLAPFIGFVLAGLCVFVVLVLAPLAVFLACGVWLVARRRRGA